MTAAVVREVPVSQGAPARLELAEWRALGLVAGVTARGTDFRLGGPQPTPEVRDRWLLLGAAVPPGFPTVVAGHQCHGTTVAIHRDPPPGCQVHDQTDGHLTDLPGVLLGVTVADCVPVYLAALGSRWIGLLHAGWRGIAAGMVEQGIALLRERSGEPADGIVVHCGVSICGDCYEVDSEVYQAVTESRAAGKQHLDLRAAILRRAGRLGITRVSSSDWCAAHHRESFYSHRASGGRDGRMVAYLGRVSGER